MGSTWERILFKTIGIMDRSGGPPPVRTVEYSCASECVVLSSIPLIQTRSSRVTRSAQDREMVGIAVAATKWSRDSQRTTNDGGCVEHADTHGSNSLYPLGTKPGQYQPMGRVLYVPHLLTSNKSYFRGHLEAIQAWKRGYNREQMQARPWPKLAIFNWGE